MQTKKRNLYHLFETDKNLELNGICLKFGDSSFWVKRAGGANRNFDTIFNEKTRQVSSKLQMASLSPEQSDKILMEVYVEAVVIKWEDVTDREGNLLDFNDTNFVQVMTDLPDLWKGLRSAAADMDHFLVVQKKEAAETLGKLLIWSEKVGDDIEFLEGMAELYKPVPILANRPVLRDDQKIILRAYNDLSGGKSGIRFSEYVLWCGTYGIQKSSIQFEFIWDVLVSAQGKLASWKRKKAKTFILQALASDGRPYLNAQGELLGTVEKFLLTVLPKDITAVIRGVAFGELNTQVALNNAPSQILVDGMSAGKRSIERAMRRVQMRFQDFTMLRKALTDIYTLLLQVTRIQTPPKDAIVARNSFYLMVDDRLVGLMPYALSKLQDSDLRMGSVIRIVGPLLNYGRKLFWNPIGTSSKMSFYRVRQKKGGVRFMPLRGASKTAPRFKPYANRTLRKKANRTSAPAEALRSMLAGNTPPGRSENANQIVKRLVKRNPAYRGLHFTDGWVNHGPAVGWSRLRNPRVPAFGVMFSKKGRVNNG